jgi:UDP-4-amino-4,6-dideoxy-L-N-acetyl-beta-L-altrosamine transaminase
MTIPIPYGRQLISSNDIKHVSKSLKNQLITTGDYVNKFENKIKKLLNCKYALTCSSGTAALHLSLLAISIKKNDVIVMPAINFVAAYNQAKILGAKIFLADVDNSTGQMTPITLLDCIKKNNLNRIKAILTMYLGGYPENVEKFFDIKNKYKCFLIEDACHAFGASYKFGNKKFHIGSCKHADISTFSFHPLKTITTGEGGAVTTNSNKLYQKILKLRSHGIERSEYHWKYNVAFNGFNYRLSDINCALGYSQIINIKKFIKKRNVVYNFYRKHLHKFKEYISIPNYTNFTYPSYHLFIMKFNLKKLKCNKNYVFKKMLEKKIFLQQHYIPIFNFKKIFKQKFYKSNYAGALDYISNTFSLPIFAGMTRRNMIYILKNIELLILNRCK